MELVLIETYEFEKSTDERNNPIFWPEVQEYIKRYKRWNIPENKLKLGEISYLVYFQSNYTLY